MNPDLFLADLEEKPARLAALADLLRTTDPWAPVGPTASWVFVGMGSSHYAAQVAAARLRSRGVPAVAELAGSDLLPAVGPGTTVVAVSASGGSVETLDAVRRLRAARAGARFVALTNRGGSELAGLCDLEVDLAAGEERGGVACRSYQHTVALLLALESMLTGGTDLPDLLERASEASAHLLEGRDAWLPGVSAAILGPWGTHVVAPARRLGSALQSALMLREGPRLAAVACETADWSHVDVYLTLSLDPALPADYRLVLLAGSRWEPELLDWVGRRGSTLVAIGGDVPGAGLTVRYPQDDVDDVRLLTETLVVELVAARAWRSVETPEPR